MGGLNLNSINFSLAGGGSKKTDNASGFHVGLISDMPLVSFLSFQSGFMLTQKKAEYSLFSSDLKSEVYYLQSPITLSFKFPINESVSIRVNGGVYLASGLFGSMEIDGEDEEVFDYFNYFDAGIKFGGGVELHSFYLGVTYDNGLANISNFRDIKTAKNRTLGFTLGYIF
jgi:hypothetical protein